MPKGNAVIYKPKEVSWEREVTLKKKKKHASWLELRAGFSHRVRDPVQPDQTLALLSEQFWPNFLPAPAGADATSLFHIICAEDLLQCEKFHHQSTQIHPFANIEKISWEQLLSKVAEGWEKNPKFYFDSPSLPPSWVSLSLDVWLISAFGEHVKTVVRSAGWGITTMNMDDLILVPLQVFQHISEVREWSKTEYSGG